MLYNKSYEINLFIFFVIILQLIAEIIAYFTLFKLIFMQYVSILDMLFPVWQFMCN